MIKTKAIFNVIFPNRCIGCHRILPKRQEVLCTKCYYSLSFIPQGSCEKAEVFKGRKRIGVKQIESLLFFTQENLTQKLLHANKYFNQPQIGAFLAQLAIERAPQWLAKVDMVTCVPSHARTLRERGYNQVSPFAQSIAAYLEVPFVENVFFRKKRRKSQISRRRAERYASLKGAFEINEQALKENENLLIVDDLVTSGATLSSCVSALEEVSPIDVYIYTIARAV